MSRCAELTEMRRDLPESLGSVPACLSRWTLRKADRAYRAFFDRLKKHDGRAGSPRFKGKGRWRSFGFTEWKGIELDGRRLRFQGVPGGIRVHMHRLLPEQFDPRSCTVGEDAKGWWVAIQCRVDLPLPRDGGEAVGIDLGILKLATLSTGEAIPNPRIARRREREMRRRQRALARCRLGSRRRRKVRAALARAQWRAANARRTHAHQVSAGLARRFALIAVEDLAVGNMTASARGTAEHPGTNVRQKAGLNRALLDVAPARLMDLLSYKAARAGGRLVKVDPRGTSRECSRCGADVPKDLSIRVHDCARCGLVLDRDLNAARNVLARALASGARVVAARGRQVSGAGTRSGTRLTPADAAGPST
jgi:putative transposase